MKKLTTAEFITKARDLHGDKYDYSKVEYVNNHTKVCIICPIHGEFWQTPNSHLNGNGCRKCGYESISKSRQCDKIDFIEKSKKVYGEKYNYDNVEYIDSETRVRITCPIHGEFLQKPSRFLSGHGCQKCGFESRAKLKRSTAENFIERAKKVHGDKYDYSKVEYINSKTDVCIICHEKDDEGKEHGEFKQSPSMHLSGQGCSKCSGNKKMTLEEFIKRAQKIHGDKYDYSKSEYTGNNKSYISIICPIHGEFTQKVNSHLNGCGCSKCNTSKLELSIIDFLKENNIEFIHQVSKKYFSWLNKFSLDFYLPKYNIAIECQGIQHFKCDKNKLSFFNEKNVDTIIERDKVKMELCKKNNVILLYYSNLNINYPYEVITDKNKLLKIINDYERKLFSPNCGD